jgi:uncharacterized protein YndB with AHSA1/START domain
LVSSAELELLARPEDVWRFVSEPHHFADWWPGVAAVEPDRRGFAKGARWQLRGSEPTLFRRAHRTATLVIRLIDPEQGWAFHIVEDELFVELTFDGEGNHTRAGLTVSGPFWRFSRSLPSVALGRLYDLCQTAAEL